MRTLLLCLILMSVIIQPPSSGATATITRSPQSSWKTGREYFTDFSSSAADALLFDLTNFTYTTDGGSPAIALTVEATVGRILTKDRLVDCDVLAKLRVVPAGIYDITNVTPTLLSRYLDANNLWRAQGITTADNNRLQCGSVKQTANAGSDATAVGTFNNADSTHYRWMRMRLTGDVVRMKWWFDAATEPAWQIVQRLRPAEGGASPSTDVDNVDVGSAGLSLQFGGFVQSLKVTELVRADDNLIVCPAPTEVETNATAFPIAWFKRNADSTNLRSVASVAGPDGDTRPVFKIVRTATDETDNSFWTTRLHRGGAPDGFLTRKMPWPRVDFPSAVEVSLWTKGTSIANVAGSLAATFVCYYYDDQGTVLNFGQPDYYATLGTNGATGGAGGKKGDGTWDWAKTAWRMHFENYARVTSCTIDVGFHDDTTTGTLWFTDLQLRPIP